MVATLNCRGRLLNLDRPVVMGIINSTPDSFFAGSRVANLAAIVERAGDMLSKGAVILDIGGASSRPGAAEVDEHEETERVLPAVEAVLKSFPAALISVDTWRASVARAALEAGAHIINDISAGSMDAQLLDSIAAYNAPYVLMHMQGTPRDMQKSPHYEDVTLEVLDFFIRQVALLREKGIQDIVLDPGFGFGKTVAHNYRLLHQLDVFSRVLQLPVLAGLSRKSMICRVLDVPPEQALNGTTALHMVALQNGARILRVHDVQEAMEVIRLHEQLRSAQKPGPA